MRPRVRAKAFIYFLAHEGAIVYVGQTVDFDNRLAWHQANGKSFDRVFRLEIAVDEVALAEGAFIRLLNPRHNYTCPADRGGDAGFLARYGLEPDANAAAAFFDRRRRVWFAAHKDAPDAEEESARALEASRPARRQAQELRRLHARRKVREGATQ